VILIFNSMPLIYLSKVSLSWIFEEIKGEKLIPETVYHEVVVKGKERKEIDAFIIDELINKGIFKVVKVKPVDWLKEVKELHKGEIEVLSLAKEKNGIAITDDSIAREIGEMLSVKVHGTLYLIFLMLKRGRIDKKTAIDKVNEMIKGGFRLSTEVYSEFLKLVNSI